MGEISMSTMRFSFCQIFCEADGGIRFRHVEVGPKHCPSNGLKKEAAANPAN